MSYFEPLGAMKLAFKDSLRLWNFSVDPRARKYGDTNIPVATVARLRPGVTRKPTSDGVSLGKPNIERKTKRSSGKPNTYFGESNTARRLWAARSLVTFIKLL